MRKRTEQVYGLHAVRQVLESSPRSVLGIWIQESITSASITSIRDDAKDLGLPVKTVPRTTLNKMTKSQNHQGVLIEIKKTGKKSDDDLDEILVAHKDSAPFFLVLDSVQDPHNLGVCLRTADAVGVTAVIVPKDRAAGITAAVRKVASGAAENVVVISVVNLVRAIKKMKEAGVWIVGTAGEARQSVYDVNLDGPVAIVMGGESKGMRPSVSKECDYVVSIPIKGQIESLNISVAAGVMLYEVLRQRGLSDS